MTGTKSPVKIGVTQMVKGHKPKTSVDPQEERMITWRMKGSLHKRLVAVAASLGQSLNEFITKTMRDRISEIEERRENK